MDYTAKDLKNITIIGAGTLGRRMALNFAVGADVVLYNVREKTLNAGMEFIRSNNFFAQQHIKVTGKVTPSTDLRLATAAAQLIIEATPEDLKIKKEMLRELITVAPEDAIIASNSSSYLVKEFWDYVPEEERPRLLNTHFMMPPEINTVELLGSSQTDPGIISYLYRQFKTLHFIPFICGKESTGFIFNRIWAAIKRECCRVIAEGVASAEDVNSIFKINFNLPVGPVEMMDRVGLDVVLDIEKNYVGKNPALGREAVELLEQYVAQNKLGIKTKEGFFKY